MHSKLVLLFLLFHNVVLAQVPNVVPFKTEFRDEVSMQEAFEKKPKGDIPSKAVVLYSNDFLTPAQWSFSNTSTPSANWQITTNLNVAPFAAFHPAGFATGYNGYGIIDSDAQGSGAHQDAILALNQRITACTNEPFVILQFAQMYRKFNDTTTVEVSNNGTTWTAYAVNSGMPNSTNTSNPDIVQINISQTAGNQDSVYIRFRYRAEYAWFWAIDDVKILRQDDFDLVGGKTIHGSLGNWGTKLDYSMIPVSQIQPIEITGKVKNAGASFQVDVKIVATSTSYNSESDLQAVPPNATAILDINQNWTPSNTIGTQVVNLIAESPAIDAEPGNNELDSLQIEITDYVYARDERIQEGRVANGNNAIGFETGNLFDMFADETLASAQVLVLKETAANSKLFVKIYEALGNYNFTYLSGSDTLVVPAISQHTWFRVRMRNPELLQAGKTYLLVAGTDGNPTYPGLVLGTSGPAEIFTTYYWVNGGTNWFNFTEKPMVRMSFESVVGIDELTSDSQTFNLYPNPAKSGIHVEFELTHESNVVISITDLTGKIISRENRNQLVGKQSLILDLKGMNPGIYFVSLEKNGNIITKKLIVE